MGTVGQNHVVEQINGRYRVYNKNTGALLDDSSLDSFWIAAGVSPAGNFSFDPRVQFDPVSNRYFSTSVDNAGGPNNILVAVSDTANPLDGWTGFSVDSDSDNMQWADFPQMGFSNDALLISANMFATEGGDFDINMLSIPKADLVSGAPTIANATLLEGLYTTSANFNFSLQPAIDLTGSGRPLRLFTTDSSADDEVEVLQLNNPLTTPSLTTLSPVTGLTPYGNPPLAQQPGPKEDLQSGSDRTRSAVKLIDGHYYGVHGVNVSGRAALRWYKINADTLALASEGVIADPGMDFFYGSIAANELGDIVVGFSGSSETQFASAYAAVGETDAAGNVSFDDPILLQAGVADYERLDNSGRNRWGDYSATVLDPSDPLTFWTFQEFVAATDEWAIQITEINLLVSPDFDNNGLLQCADVDALVLEIVAQTNTASFDLTADGLVNQDDLDRWLDVAGNTNVGGAYLVADANIDGVVNEEDFAIWLANRFTNVAAWCAGDFNADGSVGGRDLLLWNAHKFQSSDQQIPEPAALGLWMVLFLASLPAVRRA